MCNASALDYPVARNEIADPVLADRVANGSTRLFVPQATGEIAVRRHRAGGNSEERLPDLNLIVRTADE